MPNESVDTKTEAWSPQLFEVDNVLEGDEGETPEVEEGAVTKVTESESPEDEIEVEGKTPAVETEEGELAKARKEIAALKDEILGLTAYVKKPKEEELVQPKKEPEEKLTRGQIVNILKEHKDDPEVLFNVIEHLAEQKALATRDETVKDISYRQWHDNLSGLSNKILTEDSDGYLAANPKIKDSIAEYSKNLGLSDHPVGRLAAYAIIRLSELVKDKPKEEVDSSKDTTTKTTLRTMDKTKIPSTKDGNLGLTPEQMAFAKKQGLDPKIYAKFVPNKRRS